MKAKITQVKVLPDYRLKLTFADGIEGEVPLYDWVGSGVFSAWEDPAFFAQVSIMPQGGLAWPEEIELCADALYLQIMGQTAA